ncbi:hypothetical protein J1N35_013810 [Gossypium stocksii]|uniref:Transposase (putative) gypsy type domain-containing protein n=1 Tax=Gossypium stocksii TaxID=47602 RepID=A0A9D4A8Q5_9ROSI|nr:hypothetical protein J1N35_013810 [Gossypium stocksii]
MMVKIRRGSHSGHSNRSVRESEGLQCLEGRVFVEANAYPYTTKYEEISHHLAIQGIQLPNFAYEFSIVEGVQKLNDIDGGFLVPLHVLEASFHRPFHQFFYHLLKEYEIAPRQLSGFSWWVTVTYFIDCCRQEEAPLISVFQHLY